MNQTNAVKGKTIKNKIPLWNSNNLNQSNLPKIKTGVKRIRTRLISYEIVCATPRNAPINEYFEFDLHPDAKRLYTLRLIIVRKKIILKSNLTKK